MKTINSMGNFAKSLTLLSGLLLFSGCEKESVIPEAELPAEASSFISTHFPDETISQVIQEKEVLSTDFEVFLENGVSLEFDKDGKCRSIEGKTELPESAIPAEIFAYVGENYPEHQIIKWESDPKEQEVELSNGFELEFDGDGNFVKIGN